LFLGGCALTLPLISTYSQQPAVIFANTGAEWSLARWRDDVHLVSIPVLPRATLFWGASMVIAYVSPQVVSPRPEKESAKCQRCKSQLVMGYDEPQCLTCGFADYTHSRDIVPRWARTSIVSAATRYVARYVGDAMNLADQLTHVRLVRHNNRAIFDVTCPFCEGSMEESSLSGKRPEAREQRFKCGVGHRVSLVPRKNGMLGWR
jgi:hypothetical protein